MPPLTYIDFCYSTFLKSKDISIYLKDIEKYKGVSIEFWCEESIFTFVMLIDHNNPLYEIIFYI
jgi:hypothetical protein